MQFNHFATTYNDNAFIQNDLIQWGLPLINTIPLKNTSILELGAGTGLLTKHLYTHNPLNITATDLSPNMILEGKKLLPQIQWQLLNAWYAPPKTFDHIISSSLLQWCPHPQLTIKKWSNCLPRGGTIQALFFIDQTLKELRQLIPLEKILQWRTLQSWKSYFNTNGLHTVLSRETTRTYEFSNSLQLLKTLKYTGTSLKNHLCGKYLRHILKTYDKQYSSANGVYSTWQFCQLIIQKNSIT